MVPDFRGHRAAVSLARATARLKRHLLATTLLAGLATLTPWAAASAQSATAGQPAPSNADLLRMISGLQASVDELRAENRDLKAEVSRVEANAPPPRSTEIATLPGAAPVAPEPSGPPHETGLPAVSDVNFKVDLNAGSLDNAGILAGDASVAIPLSHSFGAQLDTRASLTANTVFGGGAVQWFWRDPSRGLIGVYGSYAVDQDFTTAFPGGAARMLTVARAGVEGQLYIDRVSLEGVAGWEHSMIGGRGFDIVDIAVYPTDDLRLSIGQRYTGGFEKGADGVWRIGRESAAA